MGILYTVSSRYLSRRSLLSLGLSPDPVSRFTSVHLSHKGVGRGRILFRGTPETHTGVSRLTCSLKQEANAFQRDFQAMKEFEEHEDSDRRSIASQLEASVRPGTSSTIPQQPALNDTPVDEDFTEVRGRRSIPDAGKHLLNDFVGQLSVDSWIEVLNQLPVNLRDLVQFGKHHNGVACWTCTPDEVTPTLAVPLTIAGAPVIIPIDYQVPFRAPLQPPPDPIPDCLDPSAVVPEGVVQDLFACFKDVLGFYLLLNGLLQILVPPDFDYDWAYDQQPARFGGLRVCYISHQSVLQLTANRADDKKRNYVPLVLGGSVMVKDHVEPMKAKIGVATQDNTGSTYITIPTHLITKALKYSKTAIHQESIKKVNVYHAGDETTVLGTVECCFDTKPDIHPFSFEHDLSLVKLQDAGLAVNLKAPNGTTWLPADEIGSMKLHQTMLNFLQPYPNTVMTSIPLNSTQLLTVGQGVLRRQPLSKFIPSFLRKTNDQFQYIEHWKTSISRSILYRVYPDLPEDGLGESGTAICLQDPEDATLRIVGFQSFTHKANRPQKETYESNELYKDLGEGIVAFYGAFLVPEALKEHQILQW